MTVANEFYASQYGWMINLPSGWETLPRSEGPVIAMHRPVVFSSVNNPDLSLTWMIASHPMNEDAANKFVAATEAASPSQNDLAQIAPRIFPLIGTIDSCEMVTLPDGNRALEVFETYYEEGSDERNHGYQLMLPLQNSKNYPRVFQRLCFYAPAAMFNANRNAVRESARSFHYKQPTAESTDTIE
jgi:hypothetical protein